jgi:predicted TIM-barrel fold metal-dependent hydrolase
MSSPLLQGLKVIDVDTHVVEPPDLWTSRMSSRWGDMVPQVKWDEARQAETWFVAGQQLAMGGSVASAAQAGWHEHVPDGPKRWSDAPKHTWDAKARLGVMDDYGIYAQFLYGNVVLFNSDQLRHSERAYSLELVRAYNDWQTEWTSAAPGRLMPITMLPFWDLPATLKEIERCRDLGHKGIVFTQEPEVFGQPVLTDRHWDPLWAIAEELSLPITFHLATGDTSAIKKMSDHFSIGKHAAYTAMGMEYPLANAGIISWLICSGVCHRFPKLKIVSLESGVGWLPFLLETLDWAWKNAGVGKEHPEYDLLPSEYFRRQIYGSFWYETSSARNAIELLADNILYQTDYPHPTCMAPGPASAGMKPVEYLEKNFSDLPRETLRKVLQDNASRIYNLQ